MNEKRTNEQIHPAFARARPCHHSAISVYRDHDAPAYRSVIVGYGGDQYAISLEGAHHLVHELLRTCGSPPTVMLRNADDPLERARASLERAENALRWSWLALVFVVVVNVANLIVHFLVTP